MTGAFSYEDTIAAIASPLGPAGRGIVRLTGRELKVCLSAALGFPMSDWSGRRATVRQEIVTVAAGYDIAGHMWLWPEGRSYTRQPLAEFHTAGALPILEQLLSHFCRHGARLARPGEFTLRAFLAGRLDLTQAESILGIVAARDQQELDRALRQQAGGLSHPLHSLRTRLLDVLADLEAGLDFVEEDLEFISPQALIEALVAAADLIDDTLLALHDRGRSDTGLRVVLSGPPNAGKSSLFNALLGDEQAIVSPLPGTTTDYVTARVVWEGVPCMLVDTAGLQQASSAPFLDGGELAQAAARGQLQEADLLLWCHDSTAVEPDRGDAELHQAGDVLRVFTKSDLTSAVTLPAGAISVSSLSGAGLSILRRAILEKLEARIENGGWFATARCASGLQGAANALAAARELARKSGPHELIAAEIRQALQSLAEIVGAVYTDDLLDRIFSRFCIGK